MLEFVSGLMISGQSAFPVPTRPGLWSSGWMVANSEVILFWRRGVWTDFPENGLSN